MRTRNPREIPGIAVRRGICESLLYTWRRQAREGGLAYPAVPGFVPVTMLEALAAVHAPSSSSPRDPKPLSRSDAGVIEIDLGNGQLLRVGSHVNLAALRRVLQALRG